MNYKIKKTWKTKAGLTAYVLLVQPTYPHYCGYVEVDKKSKVFRKDFESIDDISVHGGLTFSDDAEGYLSNDNSRWFFGFDTAHYGDAIAWDDGEELIETEEEKKSVKISKKIMQGTGNPSSSVLFSGVVRDQKYIEDECERLAKQLKENYE